jgi:hypothetical protein
LLLLLLLVSFTFLLLCTAEQGDYVEDECGPGYLKALKLLPQHNDEIDARIMGHHRDHLYVVGLITNCFSPNVDRIYLLSVIQSSHRLCLITIESGMSDTLAIEASHFMHYPLLPIMEEGGS